jgi:hypothetical protein
MKKGRGNMVSVTTNFTVEELRHINMWISMSGGCEFCASAKKKIVEAIDLGTIAEEAKRCQTLTQP